MGLHDLQGSDYDQVFMAEVGTFQDADKGVPADDVAAALILRDHGKTEILQRLHKREITCCVPVDEDSRIEDLVFREIRKI